MNQIQYINSIEEDAISKQQSYRRRYDCRDNLEREIVTNNY